MKDAIRLTAAAGTVATIMLLLAGLVPLAIIAAFVAAFAFLNIDP